MVVLGYLSIMLETVHLIILSCILIIASAIDFRSQRIPNVLTIPSAVGFFFFHSATGGWDGGIFSILGLITGIGTLIIPYSMGGMGAGDVKLMGVVGSALGAEAVFYSFLLTALFGGIYAILITMTHRKIFKGFYKQLLQTLLAFVLTKKYDPAPVIEHKDKPRLCYGIVIALGTFTYLGLTVAGYKF
jgi:prepilin peptidase CpaA